MSAYCKKCQYYLEEVILTSLKSIFSYPHLWAHLSPGSNVLIPEWLYLLTSGLNLAWCLPLDIYWISPGAVVYCLNLHYSFFAWAEHVCRLIYAIKGLSTTGNSASHNTFQWNVCICNLETFHSGVTVFYYEDWNSWSCSPFTHFFSHWCLELINQDPGSKSPKRHCPDENLAVLTTN